ncbi:helix-turn-helix domain-containing protein [Dellaglioa carnosa]|uniref:helix-turn-helix domain-containing protein n=1 Tax=Dellaglioa carnosa TaxID=2995136 RepID=UPI0022A8B6EB|nr:helix-turn-helix domain-containing protein [Dellaglioa carnosa]MCZ2493023.1 helix-turn-helix domain-containing protein [Dellaglioa carnosa]
MYKKDILDRQEFLMCEIIELLSLDQHGLSRKAICDQLNVSNTALRVALQQLDDEFNSGDEPFMIIKKNNVQFIGRGKINFYETIYRYVQESINYQILMAFYHNENNSVDNLSLSLNVSESSIFRRIKQLNRLLAEFDIQIAHGEMTGSEIQIRFFYYSLFLATDFNFDDTVEAGVIVEYIKLFEKYFDFNVNDSNLMRIKIWMKVSVQRMMGKNRDNWLISDVLEDMISNNSLFDQVEEKMNDVYVQFSNKIDIHFESALLYAWTAAFVPVPSTTYLSRDFIAVNRENNTKLQQAVVYLEQGFESKLNIKIGGGDVSDSLYPICAEAFCFRGTMDAVGTYMMDGYREKYSNDLVRQNVIDAMDELIESPQLSKAWSDFYRHFRQPFSNKIIEIFSAKLLEKEKMLTLGIDLNANERVKELFVRNTSQELNLNLRANVSVYDSSRRYDMVVTNFMDKNYKNSALAKYVITALGLDSDLPEIEKSLLDVTRKHYQ